MGHTCKVLLHLEQKNPPSSSMESTLLVCNKNSLSQSKRALPDVKPQTTPAPPSQVLGKVKDFLGVISEANKRLQLDIQENSSKDYDIEALSGNESQYIEMDLMLGVADLHTPEAVAAAESAIAGQQPVISLAASSSETESADSSDEEDSVGDEDSANNDNDNDDNSSDGNDNTSSIAKSKLSKVHQSKKRPKIVELS